MTALAEVDGSKVLHLVAVSWGFDRMADGSVRVAAVRRSSTEELRAHMAALRRMYPSYVYS